jgi:hypothetical protein
MTAVARIAIQECPMLVADLLLSGPALPGVTASVPTTDDLSAAFPPGSSIVPRELCQKIAVVSEDLVVGWAGGYDTARAVIGELRRLDAAQRFTNESLQRDLESLDPSVWAESGHPDSIGLVGFIRDPDRRMAQFGRSYFKLDTQLFGQVGLLGSGLDDFEKFLQQTQKLPEADNLTMNALQRSIGFGLHMGGSFLRIELATPASLQKFYGGGYEIAVSEMGKFKKVDDITYVFWWVEADGPKLRGGLAPSRAFRYSYKDDLLRIRSVAIDSSGPRAIAREQLFRVPPVYRDVRPDEEADTTRPPLNARWLCNYFLVRFADGQVAILTKMAYQPREQRWVRFEDFAGGVSVAVSQEFLEETGREVLRASGVIKT